MEKINKRSDMPLKIKILKHHAEDLIENHGKFWLDILYDSDCLSGNAKEIREQMTAVCFACGCDMGTERAHIIPVDAGGNNSVENLHLLCKECHSESESITNKELYFEWFKFKDSSNSGSELRKWNRAKLYHKLYSEGKTHLVPEWLLDLVRQNNGIFELAELAKLPN